MSVYLFVLQASKGWKRWFLAGSITVRVGCLEGCTDLQLVCSFWTEWLFVWHLVWQRSCARNVPAGWQTVYPVSVCPPNPFPVCGDGDEQMREQGETVTEPRREREEHWQRNVSSLPTPAKRPGGSTHYWNFSSPDHLTHVVSRLQEASLDISGFTKKRGLCLHAVTLEICGHLIGVWLKLKRCAEMKQLSHANCT